MVNSTIFVDTFVQAAQGCEHGIGSRSRPGCLGEGSEAAEVLWAPASCVSTYYAAAAEWEVYEKWFPTSTQCPLGLGNTFHSGSG